MYKCWIFYFMFNLGKCCPSISAAIPRCLHDGLMSTPWYGSRRWISRWVYLQFCFHAFNDTNNNNDNNVQYEFMTTAGIHFLIYMLHTWVCVRVQHILPHNMHVARSVVGYKRYGCTGHKLAHCTLIRFWSAFICIIRRGKGSLVTTYRWLCHYKWLHIIFQCGQRVGHDVTLNAECWMLNAGSDASAVRYDDDAVCIGKCQAWRKVLKREGVTYPSK